MTDINRPIKTRQIVWLNELRETWRTTLWNGEPLPSMNKLAKTEYLCITDTCDHTFCKSFRTNWNRYCSATLRRLLPKLEETKSSGTSTTRPHSGPGSGSIESNILMSTHSGSVTNLNEEHLLELREVMSSFQVNLYINAISCTVLYAIRMN